MTKHLSGSPIYEYLVGAALGLLVGTLLGLSTAPVVGSLMTGLVALLAAFFGFGTNLLVVTQVPSQRLIGFCLAAVIATLFALSVRTHDLLSPPSPSMKSVADELRGLGFPDGKIQDYIGIRFFGAFPPGATAVPISKEPDAARTMVFSASGDACRKIVQSSDRSVSGRLDFLEDTGNLALIALSKRVRSFPDDKRNDALTAGVLLLCGAP